MLSSDFLAKFKHATEARWQARPINPHIYGFQFQRGTRWNPGLSDDKIAEYENVLGVRFPYDFRTFLRAMNGTDLPTLNIYGYCPEPPHTSVGVYSYPRDIELVKHLMEEMRAGRNALINTMAEQGIDLPAATNLLPIYGHHYLVCTSDLNRSVVLSILGEDAVVYGHSLQEYLQGEFLQIEDR
jgi:SMI1/KNR4 family protein SUKH-1